MCVYTTYNTFILIQPHLSALSFCFQCSALGVIRKLLSFQECDASDGSFCGTIIITGGCSLQSELIALLSQRLDVIQVIKGDFMQEALVVIIIFLDFIALMQPPLKCLCVCGGLWYSTYITACWSLLLPLPCDLY